MHITEIYYKQLFNIGDYQNIEVGAKVSLNETESADKALNLAKSFVDNNNPLKEDQELKDKLKTAKHVANHPKVFSFEEVTAARNLLDDNGIEYNLPF